MSALNGNKRRWHGHGEARALAWLRAGRHVNRGEGRKGVQVKVSGSNRCGLAPVISKAAGFHSALAIACGRESTMELWVQSLGVAFWRFNLETQLCSRKSANPAARFQELGGWGSLVEGSVVAVKPYWPVRNLSVVSAPAAPFFVTGGSLRTGRVLAMAIASRH